MKIQDLKGKEEKLIVSTFEICFFVFIHLNLNIEEISRYDLPSSSFIIITTYFSSTVFFCFVHCVFLDI